MFCHTMPSTLISVGEYAFFYTNISTITIPEGVTRIGEYCFYECSSLTNIQLPTSLLYIGENAFKNTKLVKIEVPKNCVIRRQAFEDSCKVIRK